MSNASLKCFTGKQPSDGGLPHSIAAGKHSGFTLLELIISMTIISMVVLVLYFAFSTGVRVWDRDDSQASEYERIEAVLRLVETDLAEAVPYNMNWEMGSLALFTGGKTSLYYVTGNGTGAMAGAGAGLFFTALYAGDCPEDPETCLFLYKSPRPHPEYVENVDDFRGATEIQREYFKPGGHIEQNSILLLKGVESLKFTFSIDEFQPFGMSRDDSGEVSFMDEGDLSEDHWNQDDLPGQVRLSFMLDEKSYTVHAAVALSTPVRN